MEIFWDQLIQFRLNNTLNLRPLTPHIIAGVSNMRPAKLFCAARGHVHELKNILDKNYLYYPFH